jgi:hypothetical protein
MEDQRAVCGGTHKAGSSSLSHKVGEKQLGSIEAEQSNRNKRVKCSSGKTQPPSNVYHGFNQVQMIHWDQFLPKLLAMQTGSTAAMIQKLSKT